MRLIRLILRLALTLVLVAIAAFCCFGFMASAEYEPDGLANPFRWLYGIMVITWVAAIVAVWVVKDTRRLALTLVLVAIAAFCCFGFYIAIYEAPGSLMARWFYGAVFIACVAAIVAVWVVKDTGRLALTLVLGAIAAFCCFCFIASYESPAFLKSRWLYGAVFIACVAAIVGVVKATRRQA
jgi:hypothetical protein